MKERIYLGPSPADEPCAQVGDPEYDVKARAECLAWLEQLERCWAAHHDGAPLPTALRLRVATEEHDFGSYREVVAVFDDRDAAAIDAAFWLEENAPEKWDDPARRALFAP